MEAKVSMTLQLEIVPVRRCFIRLPQIKTNTSMIKRMADIMIMKAMVVAQMKCFHPETKKEAYLR